MVARYRTRRQELSHVHVVCHDDAMSLVHTSGAVPTITLAHRLRIAREYAGLEQTELAERAEIGRTTVVNYEQGYRTPRRIYLRAIAEATGVSLHWLETGEAPDDAGASDDVRSKGLEPPTFWLVAGRLILALAACQVILDAESAYVKTV